MCTFGFDILVLGDLWKAELLKQSLRTYEGKHFQLVFLQSNLFGPAQTNSSIKYDYTSLSWLCYYLTVT